MKIATLALFSARILTNVFEETLNGYLARKQDGFPVGGCFCSLNLCLYFSGSDASLVLNLGISSILLNALRIRQDSDRQDVQGLDYLIIC
jgi:hypothetical protein